MDEPFSLAVAKHVFKILGKRSPSELAAGEIEHSLLDMHPGMFLHDYLSDYKFITDEAVSEKREIRRVCREFGISALNNVNVIRHGSSTTAALKSGQRCEKLFAAQQAGVTVAVLPSRLLRAKVMVRLPDRSGEVNIAAIAATTPKCYGATEYYWGRIAKQVLVEVNSDVLRVFSGSPNPTITRGLGYTPFPSDLFDGIIEVIRIASAIKSDDPTLVLVIRGEIRGFIIRFLDELRRNNKAPVMEAYEKAVDSGLQMLAYTIPPFVLSTLQQRQQDQVTLAYDDDLDVQLNLAEMDEELENVEVEEKPVLLDISKRVTKPANRKDSSEHSLLSRAFNTENPVMKRKKRKNDGNEED